MARQVRPVSLASARVALDDRVHSPVRFCLLAALNSVDSADYQTLKDALDVSYTLLSKHIALLEDAGYVRVHKEFSGRTPRTVLALTTPGRDAFRAHLTALDEIVAGLT
jgi:DNA-binding MarR family transcriptional regulator